jgi:hypothetical protein
MSRKKLNGTAVKPRAKEAEAPRVGSSYKILPDLEGFLVARARKEKISKSGLIEKAVQEYKNKVERLDPGPIVSTHYISAGYPLYPVEEVTLLGRSEEAPLINHINALDLYEHSAE